MVPGATAQDDPDAVVVAWIEREEVLFRTLERHLIGDRLQAGFADDVDAFIAFSLSVQNRRKSRAGMALANHVEVVLQHNGLRYKREATTEKRAGPDFLFPGEVEYFNPDWPASALTMLGAKTTCKDRWRQVLAEADRIEAKHLLTLEPGISVTQTDEMRKENLQLVIPAGIHVTYKPIQREQIIKVADFITIVRERQA